MNGQGNVQEKRLAELTNEIRFLDRLRGKYPIWSLTRHKIENLLHELNQERSRILKTKKENRI